MEMGIQLSLPENKEDFDSIPLHFVSAVILCAGKGTRIKNKTFDYPKPLLRVEILGNKPILQTTLESLIELGIKRIAIVIGHQGYKIKSFIENLKLNDQFGNITIYIINAISEYEKGPLHSFLSICKSEFYMEGEHFLVVPGDTYFEFNLLKNILTKYQENFSRIKNFPLLFYQILNLKDLDKKYLRLFKTKKKLPLVKIKYTTNNFGVLEKIERKSKLEVHKKQEINFQVPLLIMPSDFIEKMKNEISKIPKKTIRGLLNKLSSQKDEIICIEISSNEMFFDIDYKEDLNSLSKIKSS
jgi:NDP-sugar pyrophosphorylase family protein